MSKPSPKSNFIQMLLIMSVVYLGVILIMRPGQSTPENRSSTQILTAMRDLSEKGLDQSLVRQRLRDSLNRALNREFEAKQIDAVTRQKREFEGLVLLADAQFRGGVTMIERGDRKGIGRIHQAYVTIHNAHKNNAAQENWVQPQISVPVRTDLRTASYASTTAPQLYDRIVERLNVEYKGDRILGLIPGYAFIDLLVSITGRQPAFSYAFAAFLLALFVRALIWPLTQRQLMWGRQMSQLSPLIKEIQEKYKAKPQEAQMKVMELYKEYGINPLAGCWPMLIQMPLFLLIYQCMLHYQFEFQKGTFLWINPATSAATNGFIAPNLGQLDYILITLYGLTMVASVLLTPVSDPTQARQQRLLSVGLSIFFTVTMYFGWFPVPAGFVLYWTFTNLLATGQSLLAYRLPPPPLQKVNAPNGGVWPTGGALGKLMEQAQQAQQAQQGSNGSAKSNGAVPIATGDTKTGRPVKHKPKKRK